MSTFKDLVNYEDYDSWKVKKDELEDAVDEVDKYLNDFVGRHPGGLIPDELRTEKNYIGLKKEYNIKFKELQEFNKKSPKGFLSKRSKEARGR